MSKPILYGPAYSTYVRSARMAMEEKGVDYDLVEVDFLQGPMPAEQIERHPFGKVLPSITMASSYTKSVLLAVMLTRNSMARRCSQKKPAIGPV